MAHSTSTLATPAAGALFLASAIYFYYQNKKQLDSLPPRAPGYLPVLGHLLQLVKPVPIQQLFYKWSLEAGPIFTCYFGTQRWIVLSSVETIRDLIVDRGTVYSSRNLPDTLVHDLMQGDEGGGFAFFPYGASWRKLRRIVTLRFYMQLAHGGLVKNKIDEYQPILDDRRTVLLSHLYTLSHDKANLSGQGVRLSNLIEHYTMTSILAIAFGDMCNYQPGDPVLHKAFTITERAASTMSPSDQIREFFPILKTLWPVKRAKYRQVRHELTGFYGSLLEQFKARMEKNSDDVPDCFVKEIMKLNELTDLQIINFVGIFVGAGSDTTTSTLEWMLAYLANHPEIQDKAFQEIKDTIGLERLPGAQDEPMLPYLQCIIMETLRMRPPAPIAIPHATSKDDVYRNWLIPKDTVVVMNLFAVHQDEERYPDAGAFRPERHMSHVLSSQERKIFTQSVEDRPHLSFSTGRRVCVGIHLAERNLYMAASMLLASFKFETTGAPINVDVSRDVRAATWSPSIYNLRLTPRHENIKTLIE
ncbi:cytochrome P450 [Mucor ambiguus]|uniref:Cytochrome P450 n=1 Tax=Mucor ambiguus TaxID=91626 RepID=A0A0C9MR48_9FUNG|nr:cytochrome P450 [Mucor ambiguus]